MMNSLAQWVVNGPRKILALFMILTIAAGYFAATQLTMRVSLEDLLPANHPNVQLFNRFAQQFGGANTTLVAVTHRDGMIYDPEFLQVYKQITDEVFFNINTIRPLTQSLALRKTKAVSGRGGEVKIESTMWPGTPQSKAELGRLRSVVRAQFLGHLVSDDENTAVVIADFKDQSDPLEVKAFLDGLRTQYQSDSVEINIVGRPLLLGLIKAAIPDVIKIFGLSLIIIAVILLLYFRTWIGLITPLMSASLVMVWGLGIAGLYHYNLDPLLVLLPAFIFAIVLSHSVQLTSRVLENYRAGMEWRESVKNALANLLIPGLGAVVTDAAGFLVLLLVAIPTIKSLALVCALWLLSILPVQVMAAAFLSLMPAPKSYRVGFPGMAVLWRVLNFKRIHKPVVFILVAAFGVGLYGMQGLSIGDAKGSSILWPDSQFNTDTAVINSKFSRLGTDVLQVYFEGDDKSLLAPETHRRVEALDRYIYTHNLSARPAQSLVPIVKAINMVLWEGDPSYFIVPATEKEVAMNLYMFRSRGEPGDFAAFTDNEWSIGTMAFFLDNHSAETVAEISSQISEYLEQDNAGQPTQFLHTGGMIGLTEATNQELEAANDRILIAIVVVIAACLLLFTHSLVLTGVILGTLLTATFLTYSVMTMAGIGLSLSTLPLAALGIGLGVDYAIYLVGRFREEQAASANNHDALKAAFLTSGSAIIATALTMIVPLLPWSFMSALKFQAEMGGLLGTVLFLNMIGAIVILPAAIWWFVNKIEKTSVSEPIAVDQVPRESNQQMVPESP
ncbi:MAG: efflux RND transporter permease subunit [Oceanococcus sp.]